MQCGYRRAAADAVAVTGKLELDAAIAARRLRMDVHETDRLLFRTAGGTRDSGHGDGDIRAEPLAYARDHCPSSLGRDCAGPREHVLAHAQLAHLHAVGVG